MTAPINPMLQPQRPYRHLDDSELRMLLALVKAAHEQKHEGVGFLIGGEIFEFKSKREIEDAIDDLLAEYRKRNRRATTA